MLVCLQTLHPFWVVTCLPAQPFPLLININNGKYLIIICCILITSSMSFLAQIRLINNIQNISASRTQSNVLHCPVSIHPLPPPLLLLPVLHSIVKWHPNVTTRFLPFLVLPHINNPFWSPPSSAATFSIRNACFAFSLYSTSFASFYDSHHTCVRSTLQISRTANRGGMLKFQWV